MDVKPFQLNQENMSVLLELHDLLMTWNTDETLVLLDVQVFKLRNTAGKQVS